MPDPEGAGDPRHHPAARLLGGHRQAHPRVPGGGGGDYGHSPVGRGGQAAQGSGDVYRPGTVTYLFKKVSISYSGVLPAAPETPTAAPETPPAIPQKSESPDSAPVLGLERPGT